MVRIVVRIGFGCGGGRCARMYGRGLQIRRTGRLRRSRSVRRRVGKERAFAPLLSRGSGSGICSVPAGSDDGLLWAARGCIRRGCPLRRCSGKLEGLSAIRRELSLRPNEHEVILLRTEEIRMVFLTYSAANRMCRDARSSRRRIDSRLRQDVFDGSRYGLFEPEIRSTEDPPVFTMRSSGCSFVIESPMACLPAGVLRRGRWKESGALPKPVSALP